MSNPISREFPLTNPNFLSDKTPARSSATVGYQNALAEALFEKRPEDLSNPLLYRTTEVIKRHWSQVEHDLVPLSKWVFSKQVGLPIYQFIPDYFYSRPVDCHPQMPGMIFFGGTEGLWTAKGCTGDGDLSARQLLKPGPQRQEILVVRSFPDAEKLIVSQGTRDADTNQISNPGYCVYDTGEMKSIVKKSSFDWIKDIAFCDPTGQISWVAEESLLKMDWRTNEFVQSFAFPGGVPLTVKCNPQDANILAVGGTQTSSAHILDERNLSKILATVRHKNQASVKGLDWHPSGTALATLGGNADDTVVLFDTKRNTTVKSVKADMGQGCDVRFLDQNTLATSHGTHTGNKSDEGIHNPIKIWNVHIEQSAMALSQEFSVEGRVIQLIKEPKGMGFYAVNGEGQGIVESEDDEVTRNSIEFYKPETVKERDKRDEKAKKFCIR